MDYIPESKTPLNGSGKIFWRKENLIIVITGQKNEGFQTVQCKFSK